jgi:hypothetical protein
MSKIDDLILSFDGFISEYLVSYEQIKEEFRLKALAAQKRYWDARELPRKKKKKVRKQAAAEFDFYSRLSNY